MAFGIQGGGGGSSYGNQAGVGYGQQYSATDIWGGQLPGLMQMFQAAMGLQGQQQGTAPGAAQGYVNQFMPGVNQGMAGMANIAQTGGPVGQYANPNNALAKQQLAAQSQQIGQQFGRNILPRITSGAGMAGGIGSSREALAKGVAAGDAANAIANAATSLYGTQYGIGAQAAAGATDARLQAAMQLPGAASQAFNLGMSPYQAAWAPISALSSIMGNPAILQRMMQQNVDLSSQAQSTKTKGQWGFQL